MGLRSFSPSIAGTVSAFTLLMDGASARASVPVLGHPFTQSMARALKVAALLAALLSPALTRPSSSSIFLEGGEWSETIATG